MKKFTGAFRPLMSEADFRRRVLPAMGACPTYTPLTELSRKIKWDDPTEGLGSRYGSLAEVVGVYAHLVELVSVGGEGPGTTFLVRPKHGMGRRSSVPNTAMSGPFRD